MSALALLFALVSNAGEIPGGKDRNGVEHEVRFSRYSPLSSSAEIIRRLTSPLTALRAEKEAHKAGRTLDGQPINLDQERFVLYVPAHAPPPAGYAILVFVPPWPKAQIPPEWLPALERHHMIMVSADNSGNEANPFDRRVPLALLALENLRERFPLDSAQTFVGGFSGGSRIALRLLLGYPDQFRGVLLNAGSDVLGDHDLPLPPAELLTRAQESARFVYVTGERDEGHLVDDMHSRSSLKHWCIFDVVSLSEPRRGHDPADVPSFGGALDALDLPARLPAPELASCRSHVRQQLEIALNRVAALFAHDDSSAQRALERLDAEYGGLAAPRSVELARY